MAAMEETRPLIEDEKMTTSSPCKRNSVCHPSSIIHRSIILSLICLIGVGDYYCTVSPAALQDHVLKDLHISETKYMSFYSNIQLTSIISCLCGGYLIDKIFGNRVGLVLFSLLTVVVHSMFSMGALINSYWLMFLARGIYGLVNGPMAIANDNMTVKWFRTTTINMVFGIKTSLARLSSVVALNVLGRIYNYLKQFSHGHICLGVTLLSGTLVASLSFVASTVMALLDRRSDKIEIECLHKEGNKEESVRFSDVRDFPATFWLTALTTTIYYMALFTFVGLGQVFFEMKYEMDPDIADNINSMVYLMAAITMPIFGLFVDKVGRSLVWMFVGILLSLTSHVLLAFTFAEPYIATVTLGVGYSIFTAVMWPMVAFILPLNHLGTGYGIMNAAAGVGQVAASYISGYLADNNGYLVLEVFFIACMAGSFILGSILYIVDKSKDDVINLNSKERRKRSEIIIKRKPMDEQISDATGPSNEKGT